MPTARPRYQITETPTVALATRQRQEAIRASSGKYADAFSADYLAGLRHDWPE